MAKDLEMSFSKGQDKHQYSLAFLQTEFVFWSSLFKLSTTNHALGFILH